MRPFDVIAESRGVFVAEMLWYDLNLLAGVEFLGRSVAQPDLAVLTQFCPHMEAFIELDIQLAVRTSIDDLVIASNFDFTDGCHSSPP